MVQSLGISVGNANSYVAAGQGGGIEILLNEFSNRSTPSMVAFTEQTRTIGVEANSNLFMNLKNTIFDLMVLLGKPFTEVNPANYPFKTEEAPDGGVLVDVTHLGSQRKFNMTQIVAMLLTKLRGIARGSIDCVLSCPQFYTEQQKSLLYHAALIAGLNPLQVISDMSAVALNYAYYRTVQGDSHKFIAFINFGQSNLQCMVALLRPKEDVVRILAAESEQIGGADFDKLLADHFVKTHNLSLNQKSYLKLVSACEKLKRNLSANSNEIPISVESLISEDKDFNARIERATFEEMSSDLFQRAENCFRRTLENAKLYFETEYSSELDSNENGKAEKVENEKGAARKSEEEKDDAGKDENGRDENAKGEDAKGEDAKGEDAKGEDVKVEDGKGESETGPDRKCEDMNIATSPKTQIVFELSAVEMVGGTSRIPAVRRIIQDVFKLAPTTTLNTDEAVARGCVLHCATLHPGTKIKRNIRVLGSEPFATRMDCDKNHRREELELITHDRKHVLRTEARNNLEEFIYSERSNLPDGDTFKNSLSEALDWLFSDEGEEASQETYNTKLAELRSLKDLRAAPKSPEKPQEAPKNTGESQEVPMSVDESQGDSK